MDFLYRQRINIYIYIYKLKVFIYKSFNFLHKIKSSVNNRTYEMISHTGEHLNCHTQNLVYLLTCNFCSTQNVGETEFELNIKINSHHAAKSGCERIIYHSKSFCGSLNFSYQVLEKPRGIGYGQLGDLDDSMTQIRLKRKCEKALKLRIYYPYCLNGKGS